MREPQTEAGPAIASVPTSALLAFLLTVLFWSMDALVWVLRFGSDGRYPDVMRTTVCTALSVGFSFWLIVQGNERRRVALAAMAGGKDIALRPGQAIGVVAILLVVGGVFFVWLMTGSA